MAVMRENLTIGSKKFVKNYSDKRMMIEREDILYSEAIDPIEYADERIYVETETPIESEVET